MNSDIPYYDDYIGETLKKDLYEKSNEVFSDLRQVGESSEVESVEALRFIHELYLEVKDELNDVLVRRRKDRAFIDERTKALSAYNEEYKIAYESGEYQTVIGLEDENGDIVIGPKIKSYMSSHGDQVAELPEHLKGPHITLFGPPDSKKMSINAMNAYHRELKDEPSVIKKILKNSEISPMWGADDEDSKTPMRKDLAAAAQNLKGCFDGTISEYDQKRDKHYKLEENFQSLPIKRFPGLALPTTFLFSQTSLIPLHLYDFGLHLFHNHENVKALTFYVPKLENEGEARYIKKMIQAAEALILKINSSYVVGSIRLLIVLENPRAVFRTNEIITELYPYFAGASLGWHDYLGSTARLFKEDSFYRIPVKADPDIVIKHIKASHELLANVVGKRGGIKIGGMYGILPVGNDLYSPSFQTTIKGYIRDVVTQLKRDLSGFWVAHPDFVRIGVAMVEAWQDYSKGNKDNFRELVNSLLLKEHHEEIWSFIEGEDIASLDFDNLLYDRALLAANIAESDFIANNDPEEIRYNVFQSLQYITDWLSGNGCVALPSDIKGVPIRVMDDLATAERSRWEVWHELYHGRFDLYEFLKIAHEELLFIRKDLSNDKKIVQVKWDDRTSKWYPIAFDLMILLMTAKKPVEFATEILMPFTIDLVRDSDDPLNSLRSLHKDKYDQRKDVESFNFFFEKCGDLKFAKKQASFLTIDVKRIESAIMSFSKDQILNSASFHGDIGESPKTLDTQAKNEQKLVSDSQCNLKNELIDLGSKYREKFGMKFLISAKGKDVDFLHQALTKRLENSQSQEEDNAKKALFEITQKRLHTETDDLKKKILNLQRELGVDAASMTVSTESIYENIYLNCTENDHFEIASLSKSIASCYVIENLDKYGLKLSSLVNDVLVDIGSNFLLTGEGASKVEIRHLMNHSALNMHYVNGFPSNKEMPEIEELIKGSHGYEKLVSLRKPGTNFSYSGGGFLLLEFIFEQLTHQKAGEFTKEFTDYVGMEVFSFYSSNQPGFSYKETNIETGRLLFPAFAAGATSNTNSIHSFLQTLAKAYRDIKGAGPISHDTAVQMLYGRDRGCRDFMGCDMGLGIFVLKTITNKWMLHQGANDGYRSLFLYCFEGEDIGAGITVFSTGDENAMTFNAKVCDLVLSDFSLTDYESRQNNFDWENIEKEQIVNLGYKTIVFDNFMTDQPLPIKRSKSKSSFLTKNLLSHAKVVSVSDQGFSLATNMFSEYPCEFDPTLFEKQGKVMDSWESIRHNENDFHEVVLKTDQVIKPKFFYLSTKFHDGNQVEFVRIQSKKGDDWFELTDKIKLSGHSEHWGVLNFLDGSSEFKIQVFPDGGISRVALFDESTLSPEEKDLCLKKTISRCHETIGQTMKPMHLPFLPKGDHVVFASNEHYAPASQVLSPYIALSMFDGFESARSRVDGHKEVLEIQLDPPRKIKSVDLEMDFFVNNNPKSIQCFGSSDKEYFEISEVESLKEYAGNTKRILFNCDEVLKKMKFDVFPDGGINRVKLNSCE